MDADIVKNAWTQTVSGKQFHLLDPQPEEIDEADIAHALGNLCRYGGHTSRFYSVAEHCWIMSQAVAPENALAALLHDATEAYVQDVVHPLKRLLTNYAEIERIVWLAITDRFGISSELPDEVRDIDIRIRLNERNALLPNTTVTWSIDHLEPVALREDLEPYGFSPAIARGLYSSRLTTLMAQKNSAQVP